MRDTLLRWSDGRTCSSCSRPPSDIGLEKRNKTLILNSKRLCAYCVEKRLCPKSNLFEPQLPFTQAHGNPGILPHWNPEIRHNALSRALGSPSIEHVDSNNGGRTLRGGRAEMTRSLRCPRLEGSLEGG
jgi:hypothetical protein